MRYQKARGIIGTTLPYLGIDYEVLLEEIAQVGIGRKVLPRVHPALAL